MDCANSLDKDEIASSQDDDNAIAIIGMACRLPGEVDNPSDLWNLLREGRSGQGPVPSDRCRKSSFYSSQGNRTENLPWEEGYYISGDIYEFDPLFWGISPVEAMDMDPQQRKLLEVVYESIESAGIRLEDISGRNVGCFVGIYANDHLSMQLKDTQTLTRWSMSGGGLTIASNRINYVFNLKGPSMSIDTACSSSIYALHQACQALRQGECESCIVGGSNMLLSPENTIGMSKLGVLSESGSCHTFDATADGFARAEAINALFLKPLRKALNDGDPIRAIIRGSAVNSNGKGKGMLQPSAEGQEAVIRKAYSCAHISDLSGTTFFEGHGTGTTVGDVIELEAIGAVFGDEKTIERPLLVGSTKPALGHGESASGITSIMKVVLAMENETIPATFGVNTLNPNMDLKGGRLEIVTENTTWSSSEVRRASVNSSGYGGANGHVVVESYRQRTWTGRSRSNKPLTNGSGSNGHPTNGHVHANGIKRTNGETNGVNGTTTRSLFLYVFTAHDEWSLSRNIEDMKAVSGQYSPHDFAFTLGAKRSIMAHRAYSIATNNDACDWPSERSAKASSPLCSVFVFTGQGAQYPKMGIDLLDTWPSFRKTLTNLDRVLQKLESPPNWTFENLLRTADKARMNEVEISQPLCTAVQIGLVDLLRSWNIKPSAVVGHSSGEIAAAYASGRLSQESAIVFAYLRGTSVKDGSPNSGAMLALGMNYERFVETFYASGYQQYLEGKITYACYNSPSSGTLSGDAHGIDLAEAKAKENEVFARRLATGGKAYHSYHMKTVGPNYIHQMRHATERLNLDKFPVQYPFVPMVSSVTGSRLKNVALGPEYWRENLESPVLFYQAVQRLSGLPELSTAKSCWVEIGPHNTLKTPIKESLQGLTEPGTTYYSALNRNENSKKSILELAGSLFIEGVSVDVGRVNAIEKVTTGGISLTYGKTIVDLPSYRWNYQRFPNLRQENRISVDYRQRAHPFHDLLGVRVPGCNKLEPIWRNVMKASSTPWLKDHVIGPTLIVPGAAFLAMAIEAATQYMEINAGGLTNMVEYRLRNVAMKTAISIPKNNGKVEVLFNLRPVLSDPRAQTFEFVISSFVEDTIRENCCGQISVVKKPHGRPKKHYDGPLPSLVKKHRYYEKFDACGMHFGPSFQTLGDVLGNRWTKHCTTNIDMEHCQRAFDGESRYIFHPLLIDVCFQAGYVACQGGDVEAMDTGAVPVMVDVTMRPNSLHQSRTGILRASGWQSGERTIESNAYVTIESGDVVIDFEKFSMSRFETVQQIRGDSSRKLPYQRIVWKPDIRNVTNEQASILIGISPPRMIDGDTFALEKLETLVLLLISQTLATVRKTDVEELGSSYLRHFYSWMELRNQQALEEKIPQCDTNALHLSAEEKYSSITELQKMLAVIPEARLATRVFECLPKLLKGQTTALDALFKDDLLNHVYAEGLQSRTAIENTAKILDLLAHKNPEMRILEVGGGTASMTDPILSKLDQQSTAGVRRYSEYMFSDVSTAFLGVAQKKLEKHGAIQYSQLNISRDPQLQGFQNHTFDVVVAANVLHATPNIIESLAYCRQLLKPDGVLLLCEISTSRLVNEFCFGILKSYWDCVGDGRTISPFLDTAQWDTALKKSGFNGVQLDVKDAVAPFNSTAVIMSSVTPDSAVPDRTPSSQVLVYLKDPSAYCNPIAFSLKDQGIECSMIRIADFATQKKPDESCREQYVVMTELEANVLHELDEAQLDCLKNLFESAKSILWITPGGAIDVEDPLSGMTAGLRRTIVNESSHGLQFTTLDIKGASITDPTVTENVVRALQQIEDPSADRELAIVGGMLHIPRLVPAIELNSAHENQASLEEVNFDHEKARYVKLLHPKDMSEKPLWETDIRPSLPLEPDEVEIATKAVGLNNANLMSALRMFDTPFTSNEVSGIVGRIGSEVRDIAVGDAVIAIMPGNSESLMRAKAHTCCTIKQDAPVDFEAFASLPIAFCTTIYGLLRLARLEKGESILIQAACGATGLAAIQLAKMVGAEIFCTVSTDKKRDFLTTQYGIEPSKIFQSRDGSFVPQILERTNGQGVDVVQSTMSGYLMQESFKCLAPFGRFVEIGRGDVFRKGKLDLDVFEKSASVFSFDLEVLMKTKPALARSLLKEAMDLYQSGKIEGVPIHSVLHFTQWDVALQHFSKGEHIGKIVLSYDAATPSFRPDESRKLLVKSNDHRKTFSPDSSYLLVGCLGGVGKSIATWMLYRGARKLVFLSRSDPATVEIGQFREALCAMYAGVQVEVVQGDVCKKKDVQRAVDISSSLGPIDGVINAAMVLSDNLFNTMTSTQWHTTISAKVQGTLNLHHLIPKSVSFLILLSSAAGHVGHISQSNYCSASTFLEAMARHRRSLGLAGSTIGLGALQDIGAISGNKVIEKNLHRLGVNFITEQDMLFAVEKAIVGSETTSQEDWASDATSSAAFYSGLDPTELMTSEFWERLGEDPRNRLLIKTIKDAMALESGGDATAKTHHQTGGKDTVDAVQLSPETENLGHAITTLLVERVAKLLFMSPQDIELSRSLANYGVDSLISTELMHWLHRKFKVEISIVDLVAPDCTMTALKEKIERGLKLQWSVKIEAEV